MTSSPAEVVTAITDAALALVCLAVLAALLCTPTYHVWKVRLWTWLLGSLGLASVLGFVVHGLALRPGLSSFLWNPLYMALALVVALFVVGAIYDLRGERAARAALPWLTSLGLVFYLVTVLSGGDFLVFIVYEGVAMFAALGIYAFLALTRRLPGAAGIALAIVLNLVAAAIQASDLSLSRPWPLDHNGLFHLVQILALGVLAPSLRASLLKTPTAAPTSRPG